MATEETKKGLSPLVYALIGVAVLLLIGAFVLKSSSSVSAADAAAATAAPPPGPNATALHPSAAKAAHAAEAMKTVPGIIKRTN